MPTLAKAFWPLTITAGSNDKINLVRGASYTATVAAGTYYSVFDLCTAVIAALTAQVANSWTISLPATGKLSVNGASSFQLLFSTGANAATSIRHVLGFGAVDTALSVSATAANQHQNGWYADRAIGFDGKPYFKRIASQGVAFNGRVKSLTFGEQEYRSISFTNLPAWKTKVDREGTNLNEALERLWRYGYARFRWWPDATVEATYTDFALDIDALKTFNPSRLPSKELYSLTWELRRYV